MTTKIKKRFRPKTWAIVLSTIALFLIAAMVVTLLYYPLYGYNLLGKALPDVYAPRWCRIDGIVEEYHWRESVSNTGLVSFFIKGELYQTTADYNIYRWRMSPKDDMEYLLFEPRSADVISWNRAGRLDWWDPHRLEICIRTDPSDVTYSASDREFPEGYFPDE